MDKQQKKLNLVRNNFAIWELPSDILSLLISALPLKEAVRTSILSKSCVSIWTTHMDIVCNDTNMLESLTDASREVDFLGRKDLRDKFVERVDHLMQQRLKGPNINSIVISFPLSEEHQSHITSWIRSAVMLGVVKINLDLNGGAQYFSLDVNYDPPRGYTFPLSVLAAPGKACQVKHLRLAWCTLSSVSISNSLASLVTVELHCVHFTDRQLGIMLCTCLSLEKMVLKSCPYLVNFSLTGGSSKLSYLSIKSCYRLTNLEFDTQNLEVLELEYTSKIDSFLFRHVPKLAELYICFAGSGREKSAASALYRIASDIPRLQILNLTSIQIIGALRLPNIPVFISIKHLILTVCPFHDEDNLIWIINVLKGFPLLNSLQLNQFIPSFTRQTEVYDRKLLEVAHKNLRKVEINGYHGIWHQVVLLKYLVVCAVDLELLVISPRVKVYRGLNDWYHEEPDFKTLSKEKSEELRSIVPKDVGIHIL